MPSNVPDSLVILPLQKPIIQISKQPANSGCAITEIKWIIFAFFFNFSEERTDLHVTLVWIKYFLSVCTEKFLIQKGKDFLLAFLPLPTFVLVIALFFLVCEEVLIMSAAGRAFLRPREDLRQVGKRFTGGLVLIVPDPLQISRRLAFAQGLILSREQGSARVGALILFHMRLIDMTEKSKWL